MHILILEVGRDSTLRWLGIKWQVAALRGDRLDGDTPEDAGSPSRREITVSNSEGAL